LQPNKSRQDAPFFDVAVEGTPRDLNPILRDDVYRIAGEARVMHSTMPSTAHRGWRYNMTKVICSAGSG